MKLSRTQPDLPTCFLLTYPYTWVLLCDDYLVLCDFKVQVIKGGQPPYLCWVVCLKIS